MGSKILSGGSLEPLQQFDAYQLSQEYSAESTFTALLEYLQAKGIQSIAAHTQLMIKPGYTFKTVQGIITNFHQPGSTLLLLVCAGVGSAWKKIYNHALESDYRFLSYGDSSLLYFEDINNAKG
jgi:S-adenosylmethionine:tRNA ribosyltransferase-isomerase